MKSFPSPYPRLVMEISRIGYPQLSLSDFLCSSSPVSSFKHFTIFGSRRDDDNPCDGPYPISASSRPTVVVLDSQHRYSDGGEKPPPAALGSEIASRRGQ